MFPMPTIIFAKAPALAFCFLRCFSGVETTSGLTTVLFSVEYKRKAQEVSTKGIVKWGSPRVLKIDMSPTVETTASSQKGDIESWGMAKKMEPPAVRRGQKD